MYRYAQLDADNRVIAISILSAEVNAPNLVPLAPNQEAAPGALWNGVAFSAPEPTLSHGPYSSLDFLDRFTDQEMAAVIASKSTNPVLETFLFKLQVAGGVRTDDPRTMAGVGYLEQIGILAPGRAAEILAGEPR